MSIDYADRVKEVASNKPNASTAFNLPDSAPAGFQSFDAAFASGATPECMATNGTAWESFIGTFTAGSPDTLARTTLLASSTGSAIDWSAGGDVTVFCTQSAKMLNDLSNLLLVEKNYISGLTVNWISNTQIQVTVGQAYVEQAGLVIQLTADQTITPTLSASTWHYIYLKSDGTCEVSTTAPVIFYGTAKSKDSAGNKWRLVGQFVTNASSQILEFQHNQSVSKWTYPKAGDTAVYRLINNTVTTTTLQQSLASLVPPFSNLVTLKLSNSATSGGGSGWLISDGRTPVSSANSFFAVANGVRSSGDFPCDDSQRISHMYSAVPAGGGGYLDVLGYMVGR
jgi:hypothetical protein